jgi:4-diphosphocytidyl-2-C-methyl-D-erythritol kinase
MRPSFSAAVGRGLPLLALRAPAKINLTLEVLARRGDGYHGIRSVMVPLELADELEIKASHRLAFECDDGELGGETNLALRALRAIEAAAASPLRLRVILRKHIPVQAGLGGGSSDAAAILLAAADGTFGKFPALDWLAIARGLGSDVPFFLTRTAALVEGTGERVTALGAVPPWRVVVVKPPATTSTSAAYAALDRRERTIRARSDSMSLKCAEALQRADFDAVVDTLHNDFEEIAMGEESIARAATALREAGAARPLLAGSGSCVFALAEKSADAEAIIARLRLPADFVVYSTAFAQSGVWRSERQ